MTLNKEVELLRRIPLFSKIDTKQLKLLAFTSEQVTFEPGQELFRQGDFGDAAYIIMDGEVDILVESDEGRSITVARFGRDKLIGEIAMLIDVPRTATARAVTELTALVISKEVFLRMVVEFPGMGLEVMRELAYRLERTTAQLSQSRGGG